MEVLPTLTRAGCNSGECHGAALGQGGFSLSLRGYDPEADYEAIVHEFRGRRVDFTDPDRSLILKKATRVIPHKGGRRFERTSERYAVLQRWIAGGAPLDREGARVAPELLVEPAAVLRGVGDTFALKVSAVRGGAPLMDITDNCLYSSGDDSVASVDPSGKVTITGPGETAILIKFTSHMAVARVGAPHGPPRAPAPGVAPATIDDFVLLRLAEMGLTAAGPCDDATFLRRVSLDLSGVIPTADEALRFLVDQDPRKRARAIERILDSKDASVHWTRWIADLCRVRSESMTPTGAASLHLFLQEKMESRVPLDKIVYELLNASGSYIPPAPEPIPTPFHVAAGSGLEQMEFVMKTFRGARLQCAQCHQHPFDRWSREDYYGLAGFFARTRRDGGKIIQSSFGEVVNPKTGRVAPPRFPSSGTLPPQFPPVAGGSDRRIIFANWLLSREGGAFDRAIVNRLWKELMGRGLVEPVDDLREANPASNEPLLQHLTKKFQEMDRNIWNFLRYVAESDAYQRATAPRSTARSDHYHSTGTVRPLRGVVVLDSLARATGAKLQVPGSAGYGRAASVPDEDGGSFTLAAFGRCPRDGSTDPSVAPPMTLTAALHWLHGNPAGEWLDTKGGLVDHILQNKLSASDAVERIFLAAFARRPDANEHARAVAGLSGPADRAGLADLLWALCATSEFSTNH